MAAAHPPTGWRGLTFSSGSASVRSRLIGLALLLLLPGIAIAALLTWRTYLVERGGAETALRETARGLDQLVDREFVQAEVLLRTLAATDELLSGDLAAFDRLARATAVMGGGIVLLDRTGREFIDTRLPPNAVLPNASAPPGWEQEVLGEPFISRLGTDARSGQMFVLVVLPVAIQGAHAYDLQLIVPIQTLQTMLVRQKLPAGWVTAIMDSENTLVARNRDPQRFVGRRAGADVRAGLALANDGIRDVTAVDGAQVVMAFSRSDHSRWTVTVASPQDLVGQTARRSTALLLGLETLVIAIGLVGALRVARSIARPIEAMAGAAGRLGDSEAMPLMPRNATGGLIEAEEVADALCTASRALVERQHAMTELNDTLAARVDARTAELAAANRELELQSSRLDKILDQMPIGVLVKDVDCTTFMANHEARRLMGRPTQDRHAHPKPGEATLLPSGLRLQPRHDGPMKAEDCPVALASRGIVVERQLYTLERADGTLIDVEISSAPLRDANGQIALTVTTAQDVSSRLEAEEARRRSQRLEAVGQLTGGVAHEFNNLLMAVSGCLDLLAPHVPAGRPENLLQNAARAASRGARLTGQLLAFSRRQHLRAEPVDLNALVLGMSALLEGTLGRGVEVVTELDPEVAPAMADPAQLELVLLNLAINARDAMGGDGKLEIGTSALTLAGPCEDPPPGDYVVLSVTDSGEGMTPQTLARAFEPFFTTKEVGHGSGLGLPQVLGTAQQLGGGVRISSARGVGTTVRVLLPRASTGPAPAPVRRAAEKSPVTLQGARLLLVDDDMDVREVARTMLEALGALVTEADCGEAALLCLRTGGPIDLVLADLTMPHMTGLELAAELHLLQPDLPVVLMTGYSATSLEASPHVRATLQKPFRAGAMARLLAQELERVEIA